MENSGSLHSNWQQVKEKIKELNSDISDSDLVLMHGNEDELFESLGKKLNKNKQEVKDWIESIASNKTMAG